MALTAPKISLKIVIQYPNKSMLNTNISINKNRTSTFSILIRFW